MSSTNNKIHKYRPSLTASQIEHIIYLAKVHISDREGVDNNIGDSYAIIQTLAPFQAKIANNAMSPSFSTNPKLSELERLGEVSNTEHTPVDKVAYNLSCYTRYVQDITLCTVGMIESAKEHMYVNDLMTPEEETAYELATGAPSLEE